MQDQSEEMRSLFKASDLARAIKERAQVVQTLNIAVNWECDANFVQKELDLISDLLTQITIDSGLLWKHFQERTEAEFNE